MKNKQTAIEWLIKDISRDNVGRAIIATLATEFQKALQMEREQIEEAFDEGNPNGFITKDGQQYYKETFK